MQKKWLIAIPILILLLAVAATVVFLGWLGMRYFVGHTSIFTANAKTEETLTVAVTSELKSVQVNTDYGNIEIQGADVEQITIFARKSASGVDQASAEEILKEMKILTEQDGDLLHISVDAPDFSDKGNAGGVDFTITLPQNINAVLNSQNGVISISQMDAAIEALSDYGDISAKSLSGGSLKLESQNGKITIKDADLQNGDLNLHSNYGDIMVDQSSAGDVTIKTGNGIIKLSSFYATGTLELASDYGDVSFAEGSGTSMQISNQNGKIGLENITLSGALKAESNYGDIESLFVTAGSYDLSNESGTITLDTCANSIKLYSGYGDIKVRNAGDSVLDIKTQNGAIEYTGSLAIDGVNSITSQYGAITLTLPKNLAFNFDIKTGYGKIKTNYEVSMNGFPEENHWVGKVNGGGPSLTIETDNGDIQINGQ